jgi:hypothetical protein
MFSTLVSSFASLISYTPFVFNQTMADGYWLNRNGGRILHSLEGVPAAELPQWESQKWKIEDNPLNFYANAIFVLYLLYASRGIYRHLRTSLRGALDKELSWTVLILFLSITARFACGWLLNLYYEGTLQGSRQDLIVPSQDRKMHHSLLILYLPLLGFGATWSMRSQEAEERKRSGQPAPAPQPAWDGWRTELATLASLLKIGFGSLFAICGFCNGFNWLQNAAPAAASVIVLSPFVAMALWLNKDNILAITMADVRCGLFLAYKVGLWLVAIWSLKVSLWLYVAAFSLIIYHAMPAKPKTA